MVKALVCVFFLAHLTIQGSPTTTSHHGGFSIPLIHRDATHHPRHYDPDIMITTDVRGPLVASATTHTFYVNISIGEPPLPQLLAMDTGSDMSWVQCTPCQGCHKAVSPTYDPVKSPSYSYMTCFSSQCAIFDVNQDDCSEQDEKCKYEMAYMDGTKSAGTVSYEKFTFETFDDGLIEVQNAIFGCGQEVVVSPPDKKLSGIFGLGLSKASIMSATGYKKFSYCIGNISDPTYRYNKLIIGDGAIIQGDSTPMTIDSMYKYYVRIEGISIGQTQIEDNVTLIIDSGTSLSYLPKFMLDPLKAEVRKLMDGVLSEADIDNERLCFNGDFRNDLPSFPTMSLWFGGGLIVELDVEGVFHPLAYSGPWHNKYMSIFCLAFLEAKESRSNILGVLAQQYSNVGFNLEEMSVSFQRIDCEVLEG